MTCMSESTNRSPSFMTRSFRARAPGSVSVRGVETVEPPQQAGPDQIAAATGRPILLHDLRIGALDDVLGHRDQLTAARLRAHLDGAGGLQIVHGDESLRDRVADGEETVIAQDERGLVAQVGDEARLFIIVERWHFAVVIA